MTVRHRRMVVVAVAAVAIMALGAAAGCGKKPKQRSGPAPEITGLAAVPVTAQVVIGANIAKIVETPVVDRVVDQLLLHNEALKTRWQYLSESCKINVTEQVKRVMLATGPHAGGAPGTGPVMMVVVGAIPEAELKDCVGKLVGQGGGSVTGKTAYDRTLYLAKDGNRSMYFAYGRPDTVVLGADEAFITEALGPGKKAPDSPELARLLNTVNQNASLWAAGVVDPRIRDGLVKLTEGKIRAGPVAFTLTLDLADGAAVVLSAVMSSAEDAKSLESYANGEKALLTAAAQLKSLGSVVGKITVAAENDVVHFRAPLTVDDLNQLLSALDGGTPAQQDSAPPTPKAGASGEAGESGATSGSGSGTK
jgi:hypothetical protein